MYMIPTILYTVEGSAGPHIWCTMLATEPPTPKTPPGRPVRGLRTVTLRNRRLAEARVHAETRDKHPRPTQQLRVRGVPKNKIPLRTPSDTLTSGADETRRHHRTSL